MYLTSLEIQGFKSFPEKVHLDFNEGITGIVGPNGSGKSNISDAVTWVLGEQSAKTLRGSSMQDVIFSGTQKRKAMGFAQVTITLDNSTGILPTPYEEVSVTRKLYRSGESEYLINKTPCRLKDIHALFMDTGLGRDGYSIIGQGRISEILSNRSEDRRNFFEEATGITKYRYRKQEAERKLSETRQNMLRIMDVLLELENQIGPLGEQAEKAKTYLALRDSLKRLDVNVAIYRIERLKGQMEETDEYYEIAREQLERDEGTLSEKEGKLEGYTEYVREKTLQIEAVQNKIHEAENAVKALENEIEILLNNKQNTAENRARMDGEIEQLAGRIIALSEAVAKNEAEVARFAEKRTEAAKTEEALLKDCEQAHKAVLEKEEALRKAEAERAERERRREVHREKIRSLEALSGNVSSRQDTVLREKTQQEKQLDELLKKLKQIEDELSDAESDASLYEERCERGNARILSLREAHQEAVKKTEELSSALREKQSRLRWLTDLEKDYEGYAKSVKNVLKEAEDGELANVKIHGVLSQLIRTDKRDALAIEVALGGALQDIVVETPEDAKAAIEVLKKKHWGRATFLPVTTVKKDPKVSFDAFVKSAKGYVALASELVETDGHYREIVESLLGKTVVVETINDGIKMSKANGHRFRIVSLTGEVFHPGGSMAGGSQNKTISFLSRAAEAEALKLEIEAQEKEVKKAEAAAGEANRAVQNAVTENAQNEKLRSTHDSHIASLKTSREHQKALYDSLKAASLDLLAEEAKLTNDIESMAEAKMRLEAEIIALTEENKEAENTLKVLAEALDEAKAKEARMNEAQMEQKLQVGLVEKEEEVARLKGQELLLEQKAKEAEKAEKEAGREALTQKDNEADWKINALRRDVEAKHSVAEALREEKEEALKKRISGEGQVTQFQQELRELREAVKQAQAEFYRMENKKAKTEQDYEGVLNQLWEDYQLTYSTALELREDIGDISEAQKESAKLKSQIRALGEINVGAIEEYKEVKERYEFLSNQKEDLESAEASLLKVIQDMLAWMKKQFESQFALINEQFGVVFSQLFGGGRGNIRLSDPEDVLGSGIEIDVQPPGKRLQSISLLSGGEKAMAAIALLFAILKVRPTPFCILDEIEAALDEANVYHFATFLKEFCRETQFLVVTHRRGTMEAANTLYGIAMQEKGVSSILQLKFEEIEGKAGKLA